MPDPAELLAVARQLSTNPTPPTDAQLRRAVSTAYYALFHKILRLAVGSFIGTERENTPGYITLYRSFEHSRMREICEAIDKSTMSQHYQRQLRVHAVSQTMRDFARAFMVLQQWRHAADYDPVTVLQPSNVFDIIFETESAMRALDTAPQAEVFDIMALMMVKTRA